MTVRVLAFFICVLSFAPARGEKLAFWHGHHPLSLGFLSADGSLNYSIPLGEVVDDTLLLFSIELKHFLDYDSLGAPYSKWSVPQLRTFVMRTKNGSFWSAPNGQHYRIEISNALIDTTEIGDHEFIALVNGEEVKIHLKNHTLIYREGELRSIVLGNKRYSVDSSAGRIHGIHNEKGEIILSVNWTENFTLDSLRFSGISYRFIYSIGNSLDSIERTVEGKTVNVRITYNNRVLSQVTRGRRVDEFYWARMKVRYVRDEIRKRAVLASVNHLEYKYKIFKNWIFMVEKDLRINEERAIEINSLLGRYLIMKNGVVLRTYKY